MQVTKVEIENFRALRSLTFRLNDRLSVFIGRNNSGKTSIMAALERFLSGGQKFAFSDINTELVSELCSQVVSGKPMADPCRIALRLFIDYDDADDISCLYPALLDLDPNNNTVVLEFSYALADADAKRLTEDYRAWCSESGRDKRSSSEFMGFLKSRHAAYFLRDCYSIPSQGSPSKASRKLKTEAISAIIAFERVGVPRDVTNAESDNALSRLAAKYFEATQGATKDGDALVLESALAKADEELSRSYGVIFREVAETIKAFGGSRPGETEVSFKSTLRENELLPDNITLTYLDGTGEVDLPESHNGLGYMNLIGMLMRLKTIASGLRCDAQAGKEPAAVNLLFIEEPEAHTHPQLQRIFMSNIKSLLAQESRVGSNVPISLQTMMSTHSAHIVASTDFGDIKYLHRSGKAIVVRDLRSLEDAYVNASQPYDSWFRFLKQYLTLARSDVFFADKLVLVEGDTERILLPAMMRKADCNSVAPSKSGDLPPTPLLSQDVSIIEVGNNSRVFDPLIRFLGIKTLILTDADYVDGSRSACPHDMAKDTSNYSLKHYLKGIGKYDDDPVGCLGSNCAFFLSADGEVAGGGWSSDSSGPVCIAVQGAVKVGGGTVHPRSFEEAFICENQDFLAAKKDSFVSLKNRSKLDDSSATAYDLARDCVESKSDFAIDVLLCSEDDADGKPFANWKTPAYIEEGLRWLQRP